MTKEELHGIIEKLSEYGLVRTCKLVHPDVVTIVMTDGFSENMMKSMGALELMQNSFPDHPVLETCITEENFCCVVLKKVSE